MSRRTRAKRAQQAQGHRQVIGAAQHAPMNRCQVPERTSFRTSPTSGMTQVLALCSLVAAMGFAPCALADADPDPMVPPAKSTSIARLAEQAASAPEPADPTAAGSAGPGGAVFSPFAIGTVGAPLPGPATTPDEGDLTWSITSSFAGLLAVAYLLRRAWNG